MSVKVFISGSISIKKIPRDVFTSLDKIISSNFEILVGDAYGVDKLVQEYCLNKNYFRVTVYSILATPRNRISEYFNYKKIQVDVNIKNGAERQQQKDIAMTKDSDYSFVIWDEKSRGSYQNIVRAIKSNKKVKVYLMRHKKFLEKNKITQKEIEYIFRERNGYTASEVIIYLRENVSGYLKNSHDLYKYLLRKSLIKKENNIYLPVDNKSKMFIVDTYKGRSKGIRFSNEFIKWIKNELKFTLQKETTFFENIA